MPDELTHPRQRPVTNIVAIMVFAATFLPILGAHFQLRERKKASLD
jgi:putative spermidine/putrescine transport system permease protein